MVKTNRFIPLQFFIGQDFFLFFLNNYRESANYESRLFRDRPMSATKTVNFWVEYVIRNGPNALKSPAIDLYWWEIALLDVYSFILLCFLLIIYLAILIAKYAFCIFFRTSGNLQAEKKKNQ